MEEKSLENIFKMSVEDENFFQNVSILETHIRQLVTEIHIKKENESHLKAMLENCNGWAMKSQEALKRAEAAESESHAATTAAIKLSTERDIAVRQTAALKSQIDVLLAGEAKLQKMVEDLRNIKKLEESEEAKYLMKINNITLERDQMVNRVSKLQQNMANINSEFQKLSEMQGKLEDEFKAASVLHNQQCEENYKLKLQIDNLENKLTSAVNENVDLKFELSEMKKSTENETKISWCADCNLMFSNIVN